MSSRAAVKPTEPIRLWPARDGQDWSNETSGSLVKCARVVGARLDLHQWTDELRERLEEEINPQDASSISVGTFHRVCLTMLRDDVERSSLPSKRICGLRPGGDDQLCMRRPLSIFILMKWWVFFPF